MWLPQYGTSNPSPLIVSIRCKVNIGSPCPVIARTLLALSFATVSNGFRLDVSTQGLEGSFCLQSFKTPRPVSPLVVEGLGFGVCGCVRAQMQKKGSEFKVSCYLGKN